MQKRGKGPAEAARNIIVTLSLRPVRIHYILALLLYDCQPQLFQTAHAEAEPLEQGQAGFLRGGSSGHCMYVVVSEGEVDIFVNGSLVETVGPGGIVGEMALIEQKPRSCRKL